MGQEVRSNSASEIAHVIEMEEPGMCFALMSTCHTTPASQPSSVGMRKVRLVLVEVEHAHSLTQSREVLWALPQPGDCGG